MSESTLKLAQVCGAATSLAELVLAGADETTLREYAELVLTREHEWQAAVFGSVPASGE